MGIWIELGIFLLVFVFAAWQFHDLKKAKAERLSRERLDGPGQAPASQDAATPQSNDRTGAVAPPADHLPPGKP